MHPHAAPVVRTVMGRIDRALPPLPLYRALCDNGRTPHTLLLESADPATGRARRSLVVLSSALSITCRGDDVTLAALNETGTGLLPLLARDLGSAAQFATTQTLRVLVPRAPRARTDHDRLRAASPLAVIRQVLASLQPGIAGIPESVFLGGVFAYDFVDRFENLPEPSAPERVVPDFTFYLADCLLVVDHERRRTDVLATVLAGDADAAARAKDDVARIVSQAAPAEPAGAPDDTAAAPAAFAYGAPPGSETDCDEQAFAQRVTRLQAHVAAGDVFQVVPSRTFSLPCADPLGAYERLRLREPAPYLFYVNTGEFVLFGASPESALRVDGPARTLEISPIAGTRARGRGADGRIDRDLDVRLEAELRMDPKEQAEHMMLVDLARNDVARVSRPGTRHVTQLLHVERYAHVMHLVSRVRGELACGLDALHAAQAVFPMGTLTGAPKIRAMELLRLHEPGYRGMYGGAVGYLMADGSLDTAIVIRAALVRDGIARVRAGAGVVQDSVPASEADETRRKAEAVLRAIAESAGGRGAGG